MYAVFLVFLSFFSISVNAAEPAPLVSMGEGRLAYGTVIIATGRTKRALI